ncbi:DUF5672 family protein [Spongiimicrobium salis]|uniref:DUF5672 family protein n=1 Tax=Spongiimicrobium salis TaxID=1667022 RepID=UPI00374D277D
MKKLNNVTLLGIDCIDIERLVVAAEISTKKIEFGAVKLLSNLTYPNYDIIKIPKIDSIEKYSKFMIKELFKYVDTDYVLIFQHDGFVLNPDNWSDSFLEFDYIGACWPWYQDAYDIGNGGFSLRSKKLLKMLAHDPCIFEFHPEDYIICRTYGAYLRKQGIKFASREIADKFSLEKERWEGQFGFHQADLSNWNINEYLDKSRFSKYYELFYETFPDALFKERNVV